MSYHHVDPATLEPTPDRPSVQRSISDACGLEKLALHRYEVGPGEAVPLAYHYHDEQEEAFYVLEGALHVETPEREYVVESGEAFVVEPEAPQFAHVPEDGVETTALVVGAPAVNGDAHPYEDA
ncbi:cupin domain-containing protein [Halorarum salinum]|uniref:Cupin domain-containing protein n=1 Tax=Halorarum salinum TaxID=2743089 RepID=A0A7D5Q802_9EURY|nr:cupin domain-containing protein [Halobaculum salinum]QLG60597.1 cupin domain-containing protein [Halobaculum salinum]